MTGPPSIAAPIAVRWLLLVMQQLGNYQLIRQLAVGGMAEVFLAKTFGVAGFEKTVALKMIHPHLATNADFVSMLVEEAKIAAKLTHPNVAQTLDLGCVDGQYFIAMEYVAGIDAYNLVRAATFSGIMLPIEACVLIMRDVAAALDHAHCKTDDFGRPLGIIHRDVSPDNVLISYEGVVKLVDFGIAKAAMRSIQTGLGTIKGKWLHMSPEQTRGEPLEPTADIYSAATVLYQLLTGRPVYDCDDLNLLVSLIRTGAFVPPSTFRADVPPQLDRIIVRALATNPRERYRSADAFAGELQNFLYSYSPHAGAATLASLVSVVLEKAGVSSPELAPVPAPPVVAVAESRKRAGTVPGVEAPPTRALRVTNQPPTRASLPSEPPGKALELPDRSFQLSKSTEMPSQPAPSTLLRSVTDRPTEPLTAQAFASESSGRFPADDPSTTPDTPSGSSIESESSGRFPTNDPATTPHLPSKTPQAPSKASHTPSKTPQAPSKASRTPSKAPAAPNKAPAAPNKAPRTPSKSRVESQSIGAFPATDPPTRPQQPSEELLRSSETPPSEPRARPSRNVIARKPKPTGEAPRASADGESAAEDPSTQIVIEVD